MSDAFVRAAEAAQALRERAGVASFDAAVVLGSGWVPAADALGTPSAEIAVTDLPGFAPPAVAGHAGRIRVVECGGRHVLVFLGRTHLYEGHGTDAVVHGVRTALAAGVRTVVLTNAAGGLRPETQRVGEPVLISDHINLTGDHPLTGATFVDMSEAYSARLRDLARTADPSLAEGVYAALRGPTYETPAEIRMLRTLGADLVGMSTALETIAARRGLPDAEPAEVLAFSLVTNVAAGLSDRHLDHAEVLAEGRAAAARMGALLATLVPKL
ncbi:purine-nucleoside phosphorylase [Actinomadura rayongensis]|uniref:Purine nucleoside phosphorylase n=1 Tax=Actinomadura rayongensis TaxID=1429076 RepID=A0A6I4W2G7_9ACTN|nr:purine-nucleoside phosphorylase [Actinomadura rayongensis]